MTNLHNSFRISNKPNKIKKSVRPPKVYSIDEHLIPPNKIDKHAFYVIEKLRINGFLSFLVGGSVRDLLLKETPKDFDISTAAKPEEIKKIFKKNCILIGRRFRLAHIRFGRKIIEVSTFRAGNPQEAELILQDNIYGTPEQDVMRRDFTINGLYYDPEVQTVIDYVGGYPDLSKKILRTIGNSKIRFIQDPVRMIRLLKFKARFDLKIHKDTLLALKECKKEITKSSAARILEELLRMLTSTKSEAFFKLLTKHEILHILLPTLAHNLEKNKEIYTYLKASDEYNKKISPFTLERSVCLSALLFPIFKEKLTLDYIKKNKFLHLGIITVEAKHLIDDIFRPFVHLPRRIKVEMTSILTNQFRLDPFDEKRKKRIKIPRDPFFKLAIKFFKLRCLIDSNLYKILNRWHNVQKLKKSKENEKV